MWFYWIFRFRKLKMDLNLCEYITRTYPKTKVVALTMHDDASLIKRVVKKGAKGYLLKNTTKTELLQAIQTVHHEKQYFNETITHILLNEGPKTRNRRLALA